MTTNFITTVRHLPIKHHRSVRCRNFQIYGTPFLLKNLFLFAEVVVRFIIKLLQRITFILGGLYLFLLLSFIITKCFVVYSCGNVLEH